MWQLELYYITAAQLHALPAWVLASLYGDPKITGW